MGLPEQITDITEKLEELSSGADDRNQITPDILRSIATFLEDELDGMIAELKTIARESREQGEALEEANERIEELEQQLENKE